ncbi:MAG: hypothetical protein R3F17_00445 [Planctomycetota bacterium]
MRFEHPGHPGRQVALAYCSNLHPAESQEAILQGLETFAAALRARLGVRGRFGVGLYLPARVALELCQDGALSERDRFLTQFERFGLEPFTFNAFPYGDFHRARLKEEVYKPTWLAPERGQFTHAVARVARDWAARLYGGGATGHLSISTHPGAHQSQVHGTADLHGISRNLAEAVARLAVDHVAGEPPVVLSLEAEPWAVAGNSLALAELRVVVSARAERVLRDHYGMGDLDAIEAVARHLGSCLDACHSAVEFEPVELALRAATHEARPGKLQYTSALALERPGAHPEGRARLLAMDEPRFLHQVNGRRGERLMRAADLPDLAAALQGPESDEWLDCDEWRCHFHVPVDLEEFGGLSTTRPCGCLARRPAR